MLRVVSVGLGWWSDELAKAVHGRTDTLRVTGCASRSAAKCAAFAERFGARPYESYEAVLRDPAIDGVILTTPHSLHADHAIAAARAGKHVFVEKPLALTAASAGAAVEACARSGVVLAVGHNRRFGPAAAALKRMVEAGELGTILHAEANFSSPGALSYTPDRWRASRTESPAGALAALGIHMIDTLAWLLGPVERVACQAKRRAVKVDMDDTTSALLEFETGPTGYLGSHFACPYASYLRIFGTAANAEARADFTELAVQRGSGKHEAIALPQVDTLFVELEAFAEACAGGRPFPVRPEEAAHDVAIMETMASSAAQGGRWLAIVASGQAAGARRRRSS